MTPAAEFLIYVLEVYRHYKGLSEPGVVILFDRHGVFDYVLEAYPALQVEGDQAIIEGIDGFIAEH